MSRSEIFDVLYAEVMDATKALEKAKKSPFQGRETAREALGRAVQRYTSFSIFGKIPNDIKIQI